MLNQFKYNQIHIILTLILIVILSHFIFFITEIRDLKKNYTSETKIDSIVVLTGDRFRINEGIKILSNKIGSKLLLSGVNKSIGIDSIKKEFSKYDSLFTCCIEIENISSNTFENLRETFLWLKKNKYNSVLIVTSDYHVPRVKLESEKFIKKNDIYYHPVKKNIMESRSKRLKKLIFEYVKYVRTYISIMVKI